jgi:hypothetical protein
MVNYREDWGSMYTEEEREVFRSNRKARIDTRRGLKDKRVSLLAKKTELVERELSAREVAVRLREEKLALERDGLERLKVLQAEFLGNEDLIRAHRELLYKRDENGELDVQATVKALDMAYKLKGLYAPKMVSTNSKSVSMRIKNEAGMESMSEDKLQAIDRAFGVDRLRGDVEGGSVEEL